MKITQSFRLSEALVCRLELLASASRLKKGTIIEMCIERHLPELEERYAEEILKLKHDVEAAGNRALAASLQRMKKSFSSSYPPHQPQHVELNEDKTKKKKAA